MSIPSKSTPTYLDQLPHEIINIISDYVTCEGHWRTPCNWVNPAACIQSLHNAWPHSRYEALTKPYMHHGITFNGSAFNLKQIIDGFLLEPQTRLWVRFLVFGCGDLLFDQQKPFESIKDECEWLTEACTKLGLKVEDMELPVMELLHVESQNPIAERILWPYKRLEFLAQVLHRVTKFCYSTDALWIAPNPVLYERYRRTWVLPTVALQWQSEDNDMMTEPGSSTSITPVPSVLRSVNQFYLGHGYWQNECQDPYQTLLPAFFFPNIRVIQCSNMVPASLNEDLTPLAHDAPHPYSSTITTLHFTFCDMRTRTYEKFLRLPKALVECSFIHSTHGIGMERCTMSDFVHLLSNYHSKSLEILTLDGTEESQTIGTFWAGPRHDRTPERIGSLKHFENLRVIEAPIWSLVNCSDREVCNFPEVLPESLEVIKLSLVMTHDKSPQLCLEAIKGHLECMIEKKREKYPRLAIVEVYIRYIAIPPGADWDCLYEGFKDSLAGLAMQEDNVRLIIH